MIIENVFFTQDVSSIANENLDRFGLLITANKPIEGIPLHIQIGAWWILDNGAFTKKGFKEHYWEEWLDYMFDFQYQSTCLCVVVPDVVGDAKATLAQFKHYNDTLKIRDWNTALVTQDGMKKNMLPWDDFDVLFIGGTDNHKMGLEAAYLIEEGIKRDKHIHVGRVNTEYRLMQFWHCHTWDGTALTIKPEKYESIIISGLDAVIVKKKEQQTALTLFDF